VPDLRRAHCRNCGRHRDAAGAISWRGLCRPCGYDILIENIDGLHTKTGVPWQRWRFGQTRSLLGDDVANALYHAGVFTPLLDDIERDE
jgi:hypothetical protein